MLLNPADLQSPTWLKLKAHMEERLATHRRKNDGNYDEAQTNRLRGQITEAKYVLGLAEPDTPPIEPDDTAVAY
jgi:hypothetical protein